MRGKTTLYIDQWGNRFYSPTVKHLREQVGGGRISKMYRNKRDGRTVHVGYVIGCHWLTAYQPVELAA